MSGRLTGKVALVTGGSRGNGAAIARRLAAEGAAVVAGDVLVEEGQQLAASLGEQARFVRLDVTDEADWSAAVATAEEAFGRLSVLVNNAGILKFSTIADMSLEDYRSVIEVNQVGVFLGMRAAVPALQRGGGGSIVNISSVEGLGGSVGTGAYAASKFAVRGMSKVAALELGGFGIRVNSVHPGAIDTAMVRAHAGEEGLAWIGKRVAGLRRVGRPDEVAAVVAFLASDDSSYCTGAEFVCDGGATATAGFSG